MSKRERLARALERTRIGEILSRTVTRTNGLVVFNYHRIGEPTRSTLDRALFSAEQEDFARQLRFLKKNFEVIRVTDLEDVLRRPRRSVMITFDDGYRDNFELALPVLKQEGVPATFFITSGFIDHQPVAWWDEIAWMVRSATRSSIQGIGQEGASLVLESSEDREVAIKTLLRTYKDLPDSQTQSFIERLAVETGSGRCPRAVAEKIWMDWNMIREMDQAGMDIGGHTVHHPVLARTTLSEQESEIFESKKRIESELGHSITAFSYPVGQPASFTSETKEILKRAGYQWAFSFYGGYCRRAHSENYDIPRVAVSPSISHELFKQTARLPWLFA